MRYATPIFTFLTLTVALVWSAAPRTYHGVNAATTNQARLSAVVDFTPPALPAQFAFLRSYATFPAKEHGLNNHDYPGVVKAFYWAMGNFMTSRLVPDADVLRKHLVLIPSRTGGRHTQREDVAFLRYRMGDDDILVTQTGGDSGLFLLFAVSEKPAIPTESASRQGFVERVVSKYLKVGNFPPISLQVQPYGHSLQFTATDFKKPTIQRFSGFLSDGHICFIIEKVQPDTPIPSAARLGNTWFSRVKNSWRHIPLERFRVGGTLKSIQEGVHTRLRTSPPTTGTPAKVSAKDRPNRGLRWDERLEAELKALPQLEARRRCLEEVEKLAENPDAEPDKLVFFIRGLGPEEDPPQVRVLRRILRRTKDERVRTACLRMLSKWITDASEMREDVLRILRQHLADDNPAVRVAAARALGESGDVRYVRLLSPLLDEQDLRVREAATGAICTLLRWERPRGDTADAQGQRLQKLKRRLGAVLRALKPMAG